MANIDVEIIYEDVEYPPPEETPEPNPVLVREIIMLFFINGIRI